MPVKLRKAKEKSVVITPETVVLWRRILEFEAEGLEAVWKDEDRRGEYLDAFHDLENALGLRPWDAEPSSVLGPAPPEMDAERAARHNAAWSLRCALEAASKRHRRSTRRAA